MSETILIGIFEGPLQLWAALGSWSKCMGAVPQRDKVSTMLIPETVVLFAISKPSKAQLPPQDLAGSNSQCEEGIITGIIGCCTPWPNGKEVLSGMPSEKRRKQNLNVVTYFMGRFPILSLQLGLRTSV